MQFCFPSVCRLSQLRGRALHPRTYFVPSLQIATGFISPSWIGNLNTLWGTKSYGHLMGASFPFFILHPLLKLFPTHLREGASRGAVFWLLKVTQGFCPEGLCWAQESCLISPAEECSVWRAGSWNSERFYHWTHTWDFIAFLSIFVNFW